MESRPTNAGSRTRRGCTPCSTSARMMGAVSDPGSLFQGITSTCLEIFDCQQASLMLLNTETHMLQMKAASGHNNREKINRSSNRSARASPVTWPSMEPRHPGQGRRPGQIPRPALQAKKLTAAMVVPIMVRDELVGVLNISSRAPSTVYTDKDLRALEVFAENAGTCIRQSERAEWMRQTIEKIHRRRPGRPKR